MKGKFTQSGRFRGLYGFTLEVCNLDREKWCISNDLYQVTGADLGILRGGGGSRQEVFKGGGGCVRVQVRWNFHILTSKKNKEFREGGLNPLPPPPDPPLSNQRNFQSVLNLSKSFPINCVKRL